MHILPSSVPDAPSEEVSGVTCPDCFGSLGVSAEGPQRILRFRCRIGHLYSAEEVVVGKEKVIEEHLWAAVTALNELRALLRDLIAQDAAANVASYNGRAQRAAEQEEEVRRTLERNTPAAVNLSAATDGEPE